jgi:hypothetical protein
MVKSRNCPCLYYFFLFSPLPFFFSFFSSPFLFSLFSSPFILFLLPFPLLHPTPPRAGRRRRPRSCTRGPAPPVPQVTRARARAPLRRLLRPAPPAPRVALDLVAPATRIGGPRRQIDRRRRESSELRRIGSAPPDLRCCRRPLFFPSLLSCPPRGVS